MHPCLWRGETADQNAEFVVEIVMLVQPEITHTDPHMGKVSVRESVRESLMSLLFLLEIWSLPPLLQSFVTLARCPDVPIIFMCWPAATDRPRVMNIWPCAHIPPASLQLLRLLEMLAKSSIHHYYCYQYLGIRIWALNSLSIKLFCIALCVAMNTNDTSERCAITFLDNQIHDFCLVNVKTDEKNPTGLDWSRTWAIFRD